MPTSTQPPMVMHVMAGLLLDAQGRVLLAQRPVGKHLAGMWEFPGGKCEPGETPLVALARELREELGITMQHAEPLIAVPWTYGKRELLLDAWRVEAWTGVPRSLEGQALQWRFPAQVELAILSPTDCPILHALIDMRRTTRQEATSDGCRVVIARF